METHELQQLLSEMSLQEKIGQMVQLTGAYFDKEAVLTGVVGEQLPPEWITFMGNKCETWQDMRLVTELANDIYVNGVRTCRQMKF